MERFLVRLETDAGVLDVRGANTDDDVRVAIIDLATGTGYFNHGDRIVVIDREEAA